MHVFDVNNIYLCIITSIIFFFFNTLNNAFVVSFYQLDLHTLSLFYPISSKIDKPKHDLTDTNILIL